MGRWELGCIVFNSLIYKMFYGCAAVYVRYGGSAAWITSLCTGMLFVLVLMFAVKLYAPYRNLGISGAIAEKFGDFAAKLSILPILVYYAFSCLYALYNVCFVLKYTSMPKSPMWYIALFIIASAVAIISRGDRAVRRTHSLFVLGTAVSILTIVAMSISDGEVCNIMPIMGKGTGDVFFKGLKSLFWYIDIIFLFFTPCQIDEKRFKKTVLLSSIAAVSVNTIVVFAFSLNYPYEISEMTELLLYSLTKGASGGKVSPRTDICFTMSLISSSILYISLAGDTVLKSLKKLKLKPKAVVTTMLSILLPLCLCGCYDSREVEKGAYITAIGIAESESMDDDKNLIYTFKISNPVGSVVAVSDADSDADTNTASDTVTLKAENFANAKDLLKNKLTKETEFSHIKLVLLSESLAEKDASSYVRELLEEREMRSSAKFCISNSPSKYLTELPLNSDNPSRYFDLLLSDGDNPYTSCTSLLEFYIDCIDKSHDAAAPYLKSDGFDGLCFFSDGSMKFKITSEETLTYKILRGDLKEAVSIGECTVVSQSKPVGRVDISGDIPKIYIDIYINAQPCNQAEKVCECLKNAAETLLIKMKENGCDAVGYGGMVKSKFLTQSAWERFEWQNKFKNTSFYINFAPENGK